MNIATTILLAGATWSSIRDMMWLPEHGVGAVVLTNADPGWILRSLSKRKLLTVPADADAGGKLAKRTLIVRDAQHEYVFTES